ncbi:MAG: hypothetical protein RMI04_07645 [Thermofilaceae archaeon]|nr:hypothetical protein [Thermofilaceae archaeon]
MKVDLVKLAAFILAVASAFLPWFKQASRDVYVYQVPPTFVATYYVGLVVAVVATARREKLALLSASLLLSTSPVYAFFALRLASGTLQPVQGSITCLASASLYAVTWLRRLNQTEEE